MNPSPNVERIRPSATIAVSTLARRLRSEGRDIVDLSAGQPDFDTPAFISDAAIEGIRGGGTRYTPAPGLPELRGAIARRVSEETGRSIQAENVVVSCGAKHSLFNVAFSLFGPGDEVMIAAPYWTTYPETVQLARAEPVFVAGPEDRGFRVGPEELEAARTERARGLILCSPVNPTGSVYPVDELRRVAEWCREHGIILVSDEIYRKIRYDSGGAPAPGLLSLPEESVGEWVVVDGVSKAFAMTGWRIGYTLSEPDLARTMTALQSHVTSNPSTPSQLAAIAAYDRGAEADRAVSEMVTAFERRRDLITRLFGELLPSVQFVPPEGAFYLFFKVEGIFGDVDGPSASGFCTWLLEETGVAIVPGEAFGDPRYARLSFAASDEQLREAVERIASAVGNRLAASGAAPTSS